jgi:hypothetical protein
MSFTESVNPVQVVGIHDPVVNVNSKQAYVALKGGKYVTEKIYTSTSYSTSSIQFSCPPPSTNIIVDRLVGLTLYVQFVFDVAPELGVNDAPRQAPIMSIMDTLQSTINNVTLTQNLSDYVHALLRYNFSKNKHDHHYSLSPMMADQFQDYNTWTSPTSGGSARNPLAAYGEQYYQNRGGFTPLSVSLDGKTINYSFTEYLLFQSPFIWDSDDNHMGFVNVNTMDFNFTLKNDLSRMWSHSSAGPAVTSITVSFPQAPVMRFRYISPSDIMNIPKSVTYPYCPLQRFVTNGITLTAGSSGQVITNNIQLDQIPKRFYLYARRQNQDLTFLTSDTFASITNINIQFNNMSGLLASMGQQDLYYMSLRNGLDMSWPQFSNFCGSVIAVDFGLDIGLSPVESPGLMGQYNLQVTLNFTNTSAGTINYAVYLIVCNEGTLEVSTGSGIPQTGILSKGAILDSSNLPQLDYDAVKMAGGSVFGRLKSFVNLASKGAQAIGQVGKVIAPQYAAPLGALETVGRIGSQLTGSGRRRRKSRSRKYYRRRGRGLVGGSLHEDEEDNSDREIGDEGGDFNEIPVKSILKKN